MYLKRLGICRAISAAKDSKTSKTELVSFYFFYNSFTQSILGMPILANPLLCPLNADRFDALSPFLYYFHNYGE